MSDNISMTAAIESFLLIDPEMHRLKQEYQFDKVAFMDTEARLSWMAAHVPAYALEELRNEEGANLLGIDADQLTYALLDDEMRTWNEGGSPAVLSQLLGPIVHPMVLPDGTTILVAYIHRFTELDPLFELIRAEYARAFPAHGIRAETVADVGWVRQLLVRGMKMPEIAWELIYRDYPHVRTFDPKQRKAEYGDLYTKAYNRVRWLKTKAARTVDEMVPESPQDSA